jgi:hypothetical protein
MSPFGQKFDKFVLSVIIRHIFMLTVYDSNTTFAKSRRIKKKNAAILIYGEMTKNMTNVDRMLMESFACQ